MILEFKPEQQRVLERAAESGMSPEDVLDQAFALIHEQFRSDDWLLADKQATAAHIEEGFAQAERGELVDARKQSRSSASAGKSDESPETVY